MSTVTFESPSDRYGWDPIELTCREEFWCEDPVTGEERSVRCRFVGFHSGRTHEAVTGESWTTTDALAMVHDAEWVWEVIDSISSEQALANKHRRGPAAYWGPCCSKVETVVVSEAYL